MVTLCSSSSGTSWSSANAGRRVVKALTPFTEELPCR